MQDYFLSEESNRASFLSMLEEYGIEANKKYGQNFIWKKDLLNRFLSKSKLVTLKNVLEIGSGAGTLSYVLARNAKKLVSVEIDEELGTLLNDLGRHLRNAEFINADARTLDFNELFTEEEHEDLTLVSNLPYNLTTELITKAVRELSTAKNMLFLVEDNASPRILGVKGDGKSEVRNQGFLSKFISTYGVAKTVMSVHANEFYPKPRVNSELILIERNTDTYAYEVLLEHSQELEDTIKTAYSQRRKALINCFAPKGQKAQVQEWIQTKELKENIRAEELTADQFAELTVFLNNL